MIKLLLALTISLSVICFISPGKLGELSENEAYDFKLAGWIETLIQYESSGKKDFKILDSNGRYSYSCLQFQEATFKSESARYKIDGQIMDCDVQKKIAMAMIKDDWNNWRHWYTSVKIRNLGYPPKPI